MNGQEQAAQWIWYPGDFEMMLLQRVMVNRYERDVYVPSFWRLDDFYKSVRFIREFTLDTAGSVYVCGDGVLNVRLGVNGGPVLNVWDFDGELKLQAGNYRLEISVLNRERVPALYVYGAVSSNEDFLVTCNDDAYYPAACGGFAEKSTPPGTFRPRERTCNYVKKERVNGLTLLDFGRETFAKLRFSGSAEGTVRIYYGESREEALDLENCELTDVLELQKTVRQTAISKAFRFVSLSAGFDTGEIEAVCEYLPLERKAEFSCADERLDRIYEIAYQTLFMCSKEFFFDGLKRDRWVWSGDVTQCHLMNFYSFFDEGLSKRSAVAAAGKSPVKTFTNHIMDYSLLWIASLGDIYRYTADTAFLKQSYPMMRELLSFCETRLTPSGFLQGKGEDWVFIDWADLDNTGEVCAEQIYYWKALQTAAEISDVLGKQNDYAAQAESLRERIEQNFWNKEKGCYIYSRKDGKADGVVKKHPNIIAVVTGFCDEKKRESILRNVLLNENVPAITTPYMRFYEMAALCELGQKAYVYEEIKKYWGGMLDLGATTFWETYDPRIRLPEQYAMYGRKYGKSLCHAWGASPLYLIGRYFVGLKPSSPGYRTFVLEPAVFELRAFCAKMPTPGGSVRVEWKDNVCKVYSEADCGVLRLPADGGMRTIEIAAGKEYAVQVSNLEETR